MARRTVTLRADGRDYTVSLEPDRVRVDDQAVAIDPVGGGEFRIEGTPGTTAWAAVAGGTRWVFVDGRTYEFEVLRAAGRRGRGAQPGSLTAPMPATVRRVDVSPGDAVKRGDTLLILEAMKMELPIRAEGPGVVRSVNCREGDLVQPGAELIAIDPGEAAA